MHPNSKALLLAALLAASCSSESKSPAAAPAAREPAPAAPVAPVASQTRDERFRAIASELDAATSTYYTEIQAALGDNQNPSAEDWQRVQEKVKEPDRKAYLARVQALIDEDATDLAAFHALSWMLDNAREPEQRSAPIAAIEKYHLDRPEMGKLCGQLAMSHSAVVARLAEKSPHREVRGKATLALAEALKQDIASAADIKGKPESELEGYKSWFGAEHFAALQTLDPVATEKRAVELYERVQHDYGDIVVDQGTERETTLGKLAGAALHEMVDLAVGKTAPEIESVDLDSVAFKLSDYRGKVVLLDFWGNW